MARTAARSGARRRGGVWLLAASFVLACGWWAEPPPVPLPEIVQAPEGPMIELDAPARDAAITAVLPWVEVRGRAGLGSVRLYDVVLALDFSTSTLFPTGVDVDGDGIVGAQALRSGHDNVRWWTTDWGDTIIQCQLRAARGLLDRLRPETTRVGLVTFEERGRVRAQLGTPAQARAALDRLPDPDMSAATGIARAIDRSLRLLEEAPSLEEERQRIVVLLSDGVPTVPRPLPKAEQAALAAAARAERSGTRIHAVAVGSEAALQTDLYERIARVSRGVYVPIERPGDLPALLPHLSFSSLFAVTVRNRTTGAGAEAERIFPDGRFDAFAKLAPGENVLEIEVRLEDGRVAQATRTVFYQPLARPSASEQRAADALREQLRLRRIEAGLAAEIRAERARQRGGVTIETLPD